MLRKLVFTLAICGLASYASAGVAYTSNGDIQLDSQVSASPTTNISSLSFFSTGGSVGGFVDQVEAGPAAVGKTVRSVTFGNILGGTASPGGNRSPLYVPGTTDLAGVLTVLEGTITSVVGPIISAKFTVGTAFVVDTNSSLGILDALENDTLDSTTDILASYNLLSSIPILSGAPLGSGAPPVGSTNFPASAVNTSSVNQGIIPVSTGVFLFGEVGNAQGRDFLSNVDEIVAPKGTEGLAVTASSTGSPSNASNAGPDQFAAFSDTINEFAALTDVGVFGAGPGGFNPNFNPPGFSTTGDFFFTSNGGTADVIHTIVPEPATYAAFAAIGLIAVRRRRKKQAA